MNSLKRETTIAKRRPVALRPPASVGIAGFGGLSILIFLAVVFSLVSVVRFDL